MNQNLYEGGNSEHGAAIPIEEEHYVEESCSLFEMSRHQHDCGHRCYGVDGESNNLPCLHEECIEAAIEAGQPHVH